MKKILLAAVAAFIPATANAEWINQNWRDGDTSFCMMNTINSENRELSFTVGMADSGNMQLFGMYGSTDWTFAPDEGGIIRMSIGSRDYQSYASNGTSNAVNYLGFPTNEDTVGDTFFPSIRHGNSIRVRLGSDVSTFSLRGSAAALNELVRCVDREQGGSNPLNERNPL
jgi:hypothetical protein